MRFPSLLSTVDGREIALRRMARGTLFSFVFTQCAFPLGAVWAQSTEPIGAPVRPMPELKPLRIKPSEPLRWPNAVVSTQKLDLSRPPSEAELRAAGGMGGPLSPIGTADVAKWVKAGASAEQIIILKADNLSFGRAVQARNERNFPQASQLFALHLKDFPDSPWTGEAMLHLAMDAQVNGRFVEAYDRYALVVRNTSDDPTQPSYDLCQKTKMLWANLDITQGRWDEAKAKLRNILQTDLH